MYFHLLQPGCLHLLYQWIPVQFPFPAILYSTTYRIHLLWMLLMHLLHSYAHLHLLLPRSPVHFLSAVSVLHSKNLSSCRLLQLLRSERSRSHCCLQNRSHNGRVHCLLQYGWYFLLNCWWPCSFLLHLPDTVYKLNLYLLLLSRYSGSGVLCCILHDKHDLSYWTPVLSWPVPC